MKNVLIMMATYNGERYLTKQLDSIISQTYENWELAIQDDGSTDSTWDILNEYSQRDSRIKLYRNECGFHGAYYNFHSLANRFKPEAKYQYYMFSDQDDIWLADKIQLMINTIEKTNDSIPSLAYFDMALCDETDAITAKSFDKIFHIHNRNKYNIFFSSKISGCNTIMNRNAFLSVPVLEVDAELSDKLAHDALYAKVSAFTGNVVYDPQITMLYRRHTENVTKDISFSISASRIFDRFFNLQKLAKAHAITYNQSLYAIRLLREKELSEDNILLLEEAERCFRNGGTDAVKYLLKYHENFGHLIETVSRSLILILGLQKKYITE